MAGLVKWCAVANVIEDADGVRFWVNGKPRTLRQFLAWLRGKSRCRSR